MSAKVVLFVVLQLYIVACFVRGSDLIVQTEYGLVQGVGTNTSKVWLSVPYAAPPVGSLRWQPPQPHAAWSGILNTTDIGPTCPQNSNLPNQQEDCLYLNIYAPANPPNSDLLPVLFFIHGGSFLSGVGWMYNGTWLTVGNIIVVSINYRLGALGFLASPALMQASSVPTTGFYGVQDQRFALEWVQNNITAFGGNPAQVTVAGQSAGAISVCIHLAAPKSFGLYSQALMESGFCTILTESAGNFASEQIITNLDCSNMSNAEMLSCLQSKTPKELVAALTFEFFYPTLHAYEITEQPIDLILNNSYNSVPLLAGTNLNESSLFACPEYPNGLNTSAYQTLLNETYGTAKAAQLLTEYPTNDYPSDLSAFVAMQSDEYFKCPTKAITSHFNQNLNKPATFMYSFEHVPSFTNGPCYGVAHEYELPFVFPYGPDVGQNLTYHEWIIAQNMRDAWTNFVANGAPAMPCSGVVWEQVGQDNSYLKIELIPKMANNFDAKCEYW